MSSFIYKLIFNTKKPLHYNSFIILLAPLIDESCSYFSLIEYVTIRKLKG